MRVESGGCPEGFRVAFCSQLVETMTEIEDKSPSYVGKDLGKDKPSPGAIPLSQVLREHFGGSEPSDDQIMIITKAMEGSLYSRGLCRLNEWAQQLMETGDDIATALERGDYSAVGDLLDQVADISPWERGEFRGILLRIPLADQ